MAEQKSGPYQDGDMVKVVNEAGEVQPDPVPSAWVGTDLLPAGTKKATSTEVSKAESDDPNAEPAGNASRDDWATYATNVKGASPEDLVGDDGKDLTRDQLREKYGTAGS
jgi:hypothetical protein